MLSYASGKAKLFAKNFSKNSNLDDCGISSFPSTTNLKLHNISITPKVIKKVITNLDSSKAFVINRWLRVVLDGKSSQECPVNTGVSQGSIVGPTLFLLYINDLLDVVICNIAIYADDTTLYPECDQVSDLWQQLELASGLVSDLRDTVDWGKK